MRNKMGWSGAVTLVTALAVAAPLSLGAAGAQEPRKIVFTSGRGGEGHLNLYVMDENGANVKPVTQGPGISFDAQLSPDGKRIAYAFGATREEKKTEIHVINVDGTGKTALTQRGELCISPVWSPDGKRIAFSSVKLPEGGPPSFKLHVMDADGKNPTEMGEGWVSGWSPDGKRLVYTRFMAQGDDVSIHTVEASGANPQQLVASKSALATFSPDGKKIAYIAEGGGDQPDLFVADADGKNPVQLTKTPDLLEFSASWSADGKRIFFTQMPKDGGPDQVKKMEIHSTDLEGKSTEQLTTNDAVDSLAGGFLIFGLLRGDG